MGDLFKLIWWAAVGLFRPRSALQAEILVLRHQLNVLRRRSPKRVAVSNIDRLVFTGLFRLAPDALDALKILKPEGIVNLSGRGMLLVLVARQLGSGNSFVCLLCCPAQAERGRKKAPSVR